MDVSPETIRQVEFREKLRGYHQDDVDEFLERMAAGLEILQERLREVTERAVRAEQRARDASEGEESLRRTLVLAQRTADLAVQEANDQAKRIVDAASAQGRTILAQAEEDARRQAGEIQSQVLAEVRRLEAAREQLREDVAALEHFLAEERSNAHTALAEAARQVQRVLTSSSPPPRVHELDLSGVRTWTAPEPSAGVETGQPGLEAPMETPFQSSMEPPMEPAGVEAALDDAQHSS